MTVRNKCILLLALCGMLALNYPLLSLFSEQTLLFGIPLLHLYLFVLWLGLILAVRSLIENRDTEPSSTPTKQPADNDTDDAAK